MYTQGTGCLFTYDPDMLEQKQIERRAFEVPNTYVRWEGRELFITRFVSSCEREDSYAAVMWDKFCQWFESVSYGLKPISQRAEWTSNQMSDDSVTAANNSR